MKKILISTVAALAISSSALFAQSFNIDKYHSEVGFAVKHLMVSTVKGEFKDFSGSIDFDLKTKTFNSLNGVINAASVDTSIVKRDNHLKGEDFFAVKKYPEMKFNMTSYKKIDNESGVITGDLTVKNITKQITFNVEELASGKGMKGEDIIGFTLTSKIKRSDFGLTYNKVLETGGVAISDKIKLEINIEAK